MRRLLSYVLVMIMTLSFPVAATEKVQEKEENKKVIEITYKELEDLVSKNNKIIEANKKMLEGLRRLDRIEEKRDELYNSSRALDSLYNRLDGASDMVDSMLNPPSPQPPSPPGEQVETLAESGESQDQEPEGEDKPEDEDPPMPPQPSPGDVAGSASLKANMALTSAMQRMIDDLHDLLEIDDKYIDKFELKFNEIEDQLVVGAKSLYIGHEYLSLQREDLQRQLEVLDYNLSLADKKFDVGMMTNHERLNSHQNRTKLLSGIESLTLEIETLEDRLRPLIGLDDKTKISFAKLPQVTEEDLRFVNYHKNYRTAKQNNHSLKQKSKNIGIANMGKYDYLRSTVLTHESTEISYEAAVENFDVAFKRVFNDIEEKARLAQEALEDYELEMENDKLAQLKYDAGFTSNLDRVTSQDALDLKALKLDQAQIDLFKALEKYNWAKRGILNEPEGPSK